MVWKIGSKAHPIIKRVASLRPIPVHQDPPHWPPFPGISNSLLCSSRSWPGWSLDEVATAYDTRTTPSPKLGATMSSLGLAQLSKAVQEKSGAGIRPKLFYQIKQRFLGFKNHKYLKEEEHFQALARDQSPKLMVIACADSRVCPSNILGFQPGEAFTIRNVANLVPPAENGPTETNAALEFAVTNLQVEHIFVIGHSSCAGIQTLMRMKDDKKSSLVENWMANAKTSKLRTLAQGIDASFDRQCRLCEKESINVSLMNLLTYPWIEDRVRRGLLSIHGGYYDFWNCTFEKWTLDSKQGRSFSVKDTELWS